MARRIALARAMALDPELIMYDEPFAGLDPISMGVAANLIRTLNDATGATTSLVVSHDVQECFGICDYAYLMSSEGKVLARGTAASSWSSRRIPRCASSSAASPTDRCAFHYPARAAARKTSGFARDRGLLRRTSRCDWARARCCTLEVLRVARPCGAVLRRSGAVLRRWRCGASVWSSRQIHAIGNRSLVIIMASGMAVGFVLALQMYYALVTLRRGRVARPDRQPVAGARTRAGGHRAAVRRARRHVADRRDRPDEGRRAAVGDGDDGDRPARARARAALSRRHRRDADPRDPVLGDRHPRRLRRGGAA